MTRAQRQATKGASRQTMLGRQRDDWNRAVKVGDTILIQVCEHHLNGSWGPAITRSEAFIHFGRVMVHIRGEIAAVPVGRCRVPKNG